MADAPTTPQLDALAARQVHEVMCTGPVAVQTDTPVQDVARTLLDEGIEAVPVLTPTGTVVGIVDEADLVARLAYDGHHHGPLGLLLEELHAHDPRWVQKAAGRTAGDVMTVSPATVHPDDTVRLTARRLLEGHHDRLPVVDGSRRLVGSISRRDLTRALTVAGALTAPGTDGTDRRRPSPLVPSPVRIDHRDHHDTRSSR